MTPEEIRIVERIAYEYWQRRGRPGGSPEVDWEKALQVFTAARDSQDADTAAPGSTPTDLGVEPAPELSHDDVEDKPSN